MSEVTFVDFFMVTEPVFTLLVTNRYLHGFGNIFLPMENL